MRNPNGYGSVVKLSGNRRRPYMVKKTIGFNEKGHPIYKILGYYETRTEANMALAEFNKNPYNLDNKNITVKEVLEKFFELKKNSLSENNYKTLLSQQKYFKNFFDIKYKEIRAYHMQETIDTCYKSKSTKSKIAILWKKIDQLAFELDIINKQYSSLISVTNVNVKENKRKRTIFTEKEIQKIWNNLDLENIDILLLLLYTGFRRTELLNLKISDVDLEKQTFTGGIKTDSGKNRIIPIHPRIYPFVIKRYNTNNVYLLEFNNKKIDNTKLYEIWNKLMKELEFDHIIHECRHTFRTRLDNANANKVCIDKLLGHKSSQVGEAVYTHKTLEQLKETILLLN